MSNNETSFKPETPCSANVHEQDTILRNLKLVATTWNLIIFVLHPLAAGYLSYHHISPFIPFVTTPQNRDGWNFYLCGFAFGLMMIIGWHNIPSQLEKAGYVQYKTKRWVWQYWLILASPIGTLLLTLKNEALVARLGWFNDGSLGLRLYMLLMCSLLWGFSVWWSLGPVIWYTVRKR